MLVTLGGLSAKLEGCGFASQSDCSHDQWKCLTSPIVV